MIDTPRILRPCHGKQLPVELFSDLGLDKLLSKHTISILQDPCNADEILRRNEIFALTKENERANRLEKTLSLLSATESAQRLLNEATLPLDRYYRQAELIRSYVAACEALADLRGMGTALEQVADCFSAEERKTLLKNMKHSLQRIESLRQGMGVSLLSLSDRNWLTPDCDAISEFDAIAQCAQRLGFTTPPKKTSHIALNPSLSDAICQLYGSEVAQMDAEMAKYTEVNLHEPIDYIPEFKFLLEIRGLIQRATRLGVPHCIAKVAHKPHYTAKGLCDVSLLVKNCEGIVPNDARFCEEEPFCFLTGANGGGKTTYLRALGINLILFLSGCPVFAKDAEIYPFDTVLSHFPKDERFDGTGRLDEEKKRAEKMLEQTQNGSSFLLFNETFSGTDDRRGFALLTDTVANLTHGNRFGLYVTHFHEVMSLDFPVLSAEIDATDANRRTFRIVRSKSSASSYAADILKKYRLDRDSLTERRQEHGN